jgi:beta-galactosidase
MLLTRRSFLEGAAAASAALVTLPGTLCASIAQQVSSPATRLRLSDGWEHFQGPLSNAWQVWHSADMAVWSPCVMPHCFNAYDACDPDTPYYRGQGWYRTHVRIDNPFANGRTLLHFEGAGQTTAAYVNQTLVGRHIGGYDEFVFDITDAAAAEAKALAAAKPPGQPAGIPIAVLCDNSPDVDRIPSDQSDFSLYGGLYRHLNLVYVPAVSIERLRIETALPDVNGPASVTVFVRLYNPAEVKDTLTMRLQVTGPQGESVYQGTPSPGILSGTTDLVSFSIERPSLWAPATPHLYHCTLTVSGAGGDSTVSESFGIRKAEFVEHGPFLLNGERLLLRGTHRHEDHAGYAAALPDEVIDREMQLIKSMGANFIRLAHYQQSRRVLDWCDRLGLLVWEEVPWCRAGVGSETMQQLAFDRLATMIDEHYNHPSIVIWGLGNEDDWPGEYPDLNQKAIRGFMAKLNDIAHTQDASRMTTYRRCDFARDIPDVYSPSIWAGWYSGRYTEYQASLEKQRERVKRMFHAEWGADSHAGRHAEDPYKLLGGVQTGKGTDERGLAYKNIGGDARPSRDGDWSETYACDLFDWHLKVQETLPWLTGSAQWIFKDFTTPLRVENPVPRINQKGVVQRDLTPKESFYVFQSYWSAEPMVRIYGHTWPVRWGRPGEARLVRVYSNCPEAELFVNGVSAGVRHRDSQDFPCAGLRWMTPFKPGRNRLRVVAKTAAGQAIMDQIEFDYQTAECGKPSKLVLQQKPSAGPAARGRATVVATLHDEHGVLCVEARNEVRFTLAGAGSLIDNLGTPAGSRVVQLANGRAEISIAAAGACTVGVSAKDIPAAFVSLQHV